MCRSITYRYNGIADRLITDAEVESAGRKEKVKALWDTGTNKTVIGKHLIEKLELQSVGNGFLGTLSEEAMPSKLYKINIYLPNEINLYDFEVSEGLLNGCDILIGMDIISMGDLAVSNYNGKTTFIFRTPSMGEFSYEPATGKQ